MACLKTAFRLATVLACLMAPVVVKAEDAANRVAGSAPTVIVVVDANRIQRESLAGRAVVAERERYQQTFNNEFEAARKQLQASEQDLARQKSTLASDVFQEKVRDLNGRVAEFQRRYQGAVRALDKSSAAASNELQKAVIEVTSEVASELGAGLVLHKQHVFLHDERMDITNIIIERLNKRLSSVPFPAPELETPTPAPVPAAPSKGKK